MGIRGSLVRAWRRLLWRYRDPAFDGLDLSGVSMSNGIISRDQDLLSLREMAQEPIRCITEVLVLPSPTVEGDALVIRIPLTFLDAAQLDINTDSRLGITRLGNRSITIEAS